MMVARIGSVGPEAFTRSDRISNGLSPVMRDHMAVNPSRVDMLLGLASQPQSAFDSNELNEEDIWGAASEARTLPEEVNHVSNVVTSPVADAKKYDMSFVGGSTSVSKEVLEADPFRFMNNGRRWLTRDKDPGMSMAYADAGRPRGFAGPLNRSSATATSTFSSNINGSSGRTPSRLIPNREALYSASSSRMLQSAPVNVPDWSKIVGDERKPFKDVVDNDEDDLVLENETDEDDERLPPHELVARSQIATFSMCEGVGRTLKGRDQRRVRTAVLEQTGFYNDQ